MADAFYPFVDNGEGPISQGDPDLAGPTASARIAVYDTMTMAPRVVAIQPADIRTYLEEITKTVAELAAQQGGSWPFQLIRELVENFIHASFEELCISILDKGSTLVFSDQGPGIPNKSAALKPSFSTATKAMKKYIRGVGSGLTTVEEQLAFMGGTISIEDNLGHGTVITVSLPQEGHQPKAMRPSAAVITGDSPARGGYSTPIPSQMQGFQQFQSAPQPTFSQQPQGYQQFYPQTNPQMVQQSSYPPIYPPYGQYPPVYQQCWPQTPPEYAYQYGSYLNPMQNAPAATPVQHAGAAATADDVHLPLTEQHRKILGLFAKVEKVGPKEIQDSLGISAPTASRRLHEISDLGYLVKKGQKYELTGEGVRVFNHLMATEGRQGC